MKPVLSSGLLAQSQADEPELPFQEFPLQRQATAPVRGALDEKNEVYKRAIEVEEGVEGSEADFESNKPPDRPVQRLHSIRTGCVIILVILSQTLGIGEVGPQP